MKTAKFTIEMHKDSDGYFELCSDLFGKEGGEFLEDEQSESNKKCYEWFEYGEYGSFEIIIDENMNIIDGKVIKTGK